MKLTLNENISIIGKAIAAGVLIGIGDVINLTVDIPYLGAFLFALGLLTIIDQGLYLYTGRIGFIGQYSPYVLFITLFGNFIGIFITTLFVNFSPILMEKLLFSTKFDRSCPTMFVMAIGCGICMQVAVTCKQKIITIMAIMVFILAGFEHCIADFMFLVFNQSPLNWWKFVLVILGNSLGSIMVYFLLNTNKFIHFKEEEEEENVDDDND